MAKTIHTQGQLDLTRQIASLLAGKTRWHTTLPMLKGGKYDAELDTIRQHLDYALAAAVTIEKAWSDDIKKQIKKQQNKA
jgi:hypothetical protein